MNDRVIRDLILWSRKLNFELTPQIKCEMRKAMRNYIEPLQSLTAKVHRVYTDAESMAEFYIMQDTGWTDEDIQNFIEENWIRINSMYDCTGKMFTVSLSVKRIPIGLSVVHHTALDI